MPKRKRDISVPSTWLLPLDMITLISSFILPKDGCGSRFYTEAMYNIEGVIAIIKLSRTCKQLHKTIIKLFRIEIMHRTIHICSICDVFYKYQRYLGNEKYTGEIIDCDYCMERDICPNCAREAICDFCEKTACGSCLEDIVLKTCPHCHDSYCDICRDACPDLDRTVCVDCTSFDSEDSSASSLED